LLLYELAAERQGVEPGRLTGTIQNDILKEYIARGTYIFPPRPSLRLTTDTFAYCHERLPLWNPISISGYHMREAGCTAVQELAFTMADAIAYVEAAARAGLSIDQIGPRLSFFFNAHSDLFEEAAKFRAARRLWARIARDRFGASEPRAMLLRFHTQTAGSSLTAQQPLNNVVRVAYQALSAVLGGTQSLHTCAYDEALALPTEEAATLALRTQQVLAEETGVAAVTDPLGGSYYVEWLTDELERGAWQLIADVDARGGAVAAVEAGFIQESIEESAYRAQQRVESGQDIVVGVNAYRQDEGSPAGAPVGTSATMPIQRIDPRAQAAQIAALRARRAARDARRAEASPVEPALAEVRRAAEGTANMLPPMREALRRGATIGEVCSVLREVWGEYQPGSGQ
jgi:methylmalonyl-CoA mutase N-terminal domain/subunit